MKSFSVSTVIQATPEAVWATFARIRLDVRHRGIIELYDEPIDGRLFGDWSMALTAQDALTSEQMAACRSWIGGSGAYF